MELKTIWEICYKDKDNEPKKPGVYWCQLSNGEMIRLYYGIYRNGGFGEPTRNQRIELDWEKK